MVQSLTRIRIQKIKNENRRDQKSRGFREWNQMSPTMTMRFDTRLSSIHSTMEGYNWNYKTFLLALLIIPVIIQISEGKEPGKNGPTGRRCNCRFCTNLRRKNDEATQRKTDAKFDFDVYNFNNKSQNYDHDSFDGDDLETIRICPEFRDLWGSQELANQVVDALKEKLDPVEGRMTRANFNRVMKKFTDCQSNNAKGSEPDKDTESKDKKQNPKGPKK
ncbi:uncharacterized protein LOC111059770 isoform X2 [Nilaparvata lugens]|uniref:uncharacterized protein LOC111059770 isoform X2 n=1 Tax=Nilaparvata lugens TaxID=108931 RepID=UPI00193D515B|nr:uncharacterized protein LOC111059770 isoform X2 [Nilaparvata lugens]XP_039287231.1 uncharacterized protein LOC111059770 isoform X2 [Nilaparvata lugens]XP_039287232.1 uncharacterized protein LOC111059770 isoform X2 [Nilaparvata lugens]